MARLTVTTFQSLDGVMQAPGGAREDRSGGFLHGGWVIPHFDEALGAFIGEVFSRAGAFLLGRGTWQIFAGWWPKVTDPADPVARALNGLPKHVASRHLLPAELTWTGSRLVRDLRPEVERLKAQPGQELQVHGSPGLIQSLLELEAVDELNLVTFPVVLGRGKRLFGAGALPAGLELVQGRTTARGVAIATYRFAGAPVLADVHPEAKR